MAQTPVPQGPTRASQAQCIRLAMDYRGLAKRGLARKAAISRGAVGTHLTVPVSKRLVVPYFLRRYEKALGLPDLMLDRADPREVLAFLQSGAPRASVAQPGPSQPYRADARSLERAIEFVLEQFAIYRKASLPIPPQIIAVLAGELEAAMGRGEGFSGGQSGSAESGTLGGG